MAGEEEEEGGKKKEGGGGGGGVGISQKKANCSQDKPVYLCIFSFFLHFFCCPKQTQKAAKAFHRRGILGL